MNDRLRQFLCLALVVGAFSVLSAGLFDHSAWPQMARTIRIIVPFPPGGTADLLVRLLAEQIDRSQIASAVVDNRPGADAGTDATARAAPTGNTVLLYSNESVIDPHLRKVNYDPLTSFEPICRLVRSPVIYSVNSAAPYRTLPELIEAARAKSGTLTLAAAGPASAFQIGFEVLKRAANVGMTFAPFPSDAAAIRALLGGHVTSALTTFSAAADQVKVGKLRVLAVASPMRLEELPDVPTLDELGYGDHELDIWYGLVAPARTPNRTISLLADWFATPLQSPEVRAKLAVQGLKPAAICGAEFGVLLRKQYDDYGRIIREANIKAE